MIIIIDIGNPDLKDSRVLGNYVNFNGPNVVLDGVFPVVARFEVLDRDDDGDANVIRELPHDWRPEDKI